MSETKNQQSKQQNQHGHQNQEPKKGQNPNDPQNRQAEWDQDHPKKQGQNHSKEGQQRQGIGTQHDKDKNDPNR
jgi:hypothetical protein